MRFSIVICLALLFAGEVHAQIKVPDVGDNWKAKVDSAVAKIKVYDEVSYRTLLDNCKNIEFIIAGASTTQPPNTIAISVNDMRLNSVNNIAAILVHESYHLYVFNQCIKLTPNREEYLAYSVEYEFLCKLPDLEDWLFENSINRLLYYHSKAD